MAARMKQTAKAPASRVLRAPQPISGSAAAQLAVRGVASRPQVAQAAALQRTMAASPRVAQLAALQDGLSATAHARALPVQRQAEKEAIQAKAADDEEFLQGKGLEEEEPLQAMSGRTAPQAGTGGAGGLPHQLRAGIEQLSGHSMADVQVHRNSSQPARVGALAYARGRDIHLGPGQEKHLPHEAWHVVQQAQGRVRPTMQAKGVAINDDAGLEAEADRMGARALSGSAHARRSIAIPAAPHITVAQRLSGKDRGKISEANWALIRKHFGEQQADEIVNKAQTLEQLRGWVLRMISFEKALEADDVQFPKPGKDGDARVLAANIEKERSAFVAACLATVEPDGPVWAAKSTLAAGAGAGAAEQTGPTSWKKTYTSHGDFHGIVLTLTQGDLVAWCQKNWEKFSIRKGGKFDGSYVVELGTAQSSGGGAAAEDIAGTQWFIAVELSDGGDATITHFGPFGEGAIDKIHKETKK